MPDLADGRARDLGGQQDDHGPHQEGRQVRAAGEPRGQDRRTSSTRSSARSPSRSPAATRAPTSTRSSARRRSPTRGDIKPISGIETPDDTTLVFKLKTAERAARLAGAGDADHRAGARGVRQEVRREAPRRSTTSTSPSPARTWSRTTPTGKLDRPRAGQVDRHRPQPQLGQVDRLPSRLPRLDQDRGGQRRPGHRLAPRAERLGDCVCCDAGSPPAPVLKQAVQRSKDQVSSCRRAARATSPSTPTIKPFDNINIRKAIIAASNRNALRLTRGGAILGDIATGWIPPGIPGFEEAGGLKQNTDLDYLANPSGDPGGGQEVHAGGQAAGPEPADRRQRQVDRRGEDPHHRHERRPGQEDRRGLPGPDREARASS